MVLVYLSKQSYARNKHIFWVKIIFSINLTYIDWVLELGKNLLSPQGHKS